MDTITKYREPQAELRITTPKEPWALRWMLFGAVGMIIVAGLLYLLNTFGISHSLF